MLQRTVTFTYATLLRILGTCFLVYGSYLILGALTANNWDSGLAIFTDTTNFMNYLFFGGVLWGAHSVVPGISYSYPVEAAVRVWLTPGPLLWVGLGLVCLSLSARRVLVAYGGLQIALWMISASVWIPIQWLPYALDQNHHVFAWGWPDFEPMFLVTLALSLVLLALYLPVTQSLRALMGPRTSAILVP